MKTNIKNILNGYHVNSKYWQDWKINRPNLNPTLFQLCLGIVLSDASMYRVSTHSYIKFEQGKAQKDFLFHIFQIIKQYTFIETPGTRIDKDKIIKSFWFKTFSHPTFSNIYELFYKDIGLVRKKIISTNIIKNYLDKEGFSY